MVRRLGAAASTGVFLLGLVAVLPRAAAAGVPVLVIDGRGFGHGVGMAQDGAYWMGRRGATTAQILGQFYPGTALGSAHGNVRVEVLTVSPAPADAQVSFPQGGLIQDTMTEQQSPGFPVTVAAGATVTLHWDGTRYTVEAPPAAQSSTTNARPATAPRRSGTTTTTTLLPGAPSHPPLGPPSPPTTAPPRPGPNPPPSSQPPPPGPAPASSSTRPLWAIPDAGGHPGQGTTTVVARNQTYRGVIEATAETGTFGLINQLDVEDYLKGMGEVLDPAWPPAALGAQAIAARTYALRAMSAGGELCDDQRCQVYLGAQAEYGAMDQAVDATRAQVLVAGTTLAATVYSANGGAFSASRQEGFGTDDDASYPYLRAAPYPTGNPLPWETRVALADVATRLGYPGRLDSVSVTQRGPSGRALSVTLNGPGGPALVSGLDFAAALGLRSTLFTLAEAADPTAPPPPQSGTFLQVSPDQVPALAEAASSGAAPAVVATERQGWAPPEWSWAAPAAMPRPVRGRSGLSIEFVVLALVLLAGVSTRLAAALRHH